MTENTPAPPLSGPLPPEWRGGDRIPAAIARALRWAVRIAWAALWYDLGQRHGRNRGLLDAAAMFAAAQLRHAINEPHPALANDRTRRRPLARW